MTLQKIVEILDAKVIADSCNLNSEIETVCGSDLMSDVLYYCSNMENVLLITGLTQQQVVYTAEMAHLKAILFIRNKIPDAFTIELAIKKKICLLSTHLTKFTCCGRLYVAGLGSCSEEK